MIAIENQVIAIASNHKIITIQLKKYAKVIEALISNTFGGEKAKYSLPHTLWHLRGKILTTSNNDVD